VGATPFQLADHVEDVDVLADARDRYPVLRPRWAPGSVSLVTPAIQAALPARRPRFVDGGLLAKASATI
jgi:hypothetical protein